LQDNCHSRPLIVIQGEIRDIHLNCSTNPGYLLYRLTCICQLELACACSLIVEHTVDIWQTGCFDPTYLDPLSADFAHGLNQTTRSTCSSERPPTTTVSLSNTAKLSSPILLPRTVSYDASSKPPRPSGTYRAMTEHQTGRRRRSSSLLYQEPPETIEHMSDQAALPNLNANWVNAKGQSSFIKLPRRPGFRSVRLL
jgi:hypothetical protein